VPPHVGATPQHAAHDAVNHTAHVGSRPVRLRNGRSRSLRLALWVVVACALLLGMLQLGVAWNHDGLPAVVLFTIVFWIWVFAGVIAWWRRPDNAIGALIVVGGLAVFLGGLVNLQIDALLPISAVVATVVLAVTVHMLHAFPSGRLRGRLSIATVIVGYVVAVGFQAVRYAAQLGGRPDLAELASLLQRGVGVLVMLATAVILASRLVGADRTHRRVLLPLFLYGILAVVLIAAAPNVFQPLGLDRVVVGVIQLAVTAGIPVAFLFGVLIGGFRRTGELDALSAWLGTAGATRPAVARALASTLGDESLRIVYWSPERSSYVGESGAEVAFPRVDADRGLTEVRVGSRLVGAITYDSRIIADEQAVRRAGEVLAIAVDRERLTAELLASNEALLNSRLRLVETADRERTRIAQDLHDGLQVQLVLLALEAQNIAIAPTASPQTHADAAQLRRRIDEAAADLRRLVHNVIPAALVEQGLAAATEDLVDRLVIPATLDADLGVEPLAASTTHTAYFVVAEALANAVKHSSASSVHVRLRRVEPRLQIEVGDDGVGGASVERGTGLRGLIDRVDVMGGRVLIDSPRGEGTKVKVELPCV